MSQPTVLILLFTLLCPLAKAQQYEPDFHFGVKAGTTFSTMRFSPSVIKQASQLGYTGGLMFRFISEPYFGIQAEIGWAQMGWKEENLLSDGITPAPESYLHTLNAIELPVMAHVYFPIGRMGRIFINIGPQFGYLFSEKEVANYVNADNPLHGKTIETPFIYGIAGGGGLELMTRIGSFGIDARYYFGLSDIFRNSKSEPMQASAPLTLYTTAYYCIRF